MRVGAVGLGNTVVVCVAIVIKSGWSGWVLAKSCTAMIDAVEN